MRNLRQFQNITAYNTAKSTLVKPCVSLLKDSMDVMYDPLIDQIGDYLFSDLTYGSTIGSKTPIGVCVAPASHFADGKARFMSLKNMSLTDPENGTTATGNNSSNPGASICWGNQVQIGSVDNTLATLVCEGVNEPTTSLSENVVNAGYLPSDYFNSENIETPVEYPFNSSLHYYGDDNDMDADPEGEGYGALVSPFNADGTKNPWSRLHALSVENGYTLTNAIITAAVNTETTGAISNSSESGHFPAAMACHRFTAGVASLAGHWYLPSICELQYLMPNFTIINAKLTALGNTAVAIGNRETSETLGYYLWSSSGFGTVRAWRLGTNRSYLFGNAKNTHDGGYRVRSFLAL